MANIFTNQKVNNSYFNLSNGATSVFIETLCISGIENATNDFKKDILIWFAQRDWTLIGMGFEGFDVSEIIWDSKIFNQQKEFIISTIDGVFEEKNWNLLNYAPTKEWLFEKLNQFKIMIYEYKIIHINKTSQFEIFEFVNSIKKYEICKKHKIYKHFEGCVICNNQ